MLYTYTILKSNFHSFFVLYKNFLSHSTFLARTVTGRIFIEDYRNFDKFMFKADRSFYSTETY